MHNRLCEFLSPPCRLQARLGGNKPKAPTQIQSDIDSKVPTLWTQTLLPKDSSQQDQFCSILDTISAHNSVQELLPAKSILLHAPLPSILQNCYTSSGTKYDLHFLSQRYSTLPSLAMIYFPFLVGLTAFERTTATSKKNSAGKR